MTQYITSYGSTMPEEHWAAIEPFVKDVIRASMPADVNAARNDFAAVTSLTRWAWLRGMELDAQVLLRRDVIEQWASSPEVDLKQATRTTYRGRLFRIEQCLLEGPRRAVPMRTFKRDDNASRPYSDAEVAAFRVWARSQPSQHRREQATILLSLGFGAGLTTSEIIALTHHDIKVDDYGVLLNVEGRRARQVQVSAGWEQRLRDTAATASLRNDFVFCPGRRTRANPRMVAAFVEDCTKDVALLNTQRMRATWLAAHLTAGVPPKVVIAAAGISTIGGLERISKFVAQPDELTVRLWMRNAQTSPTTPPQAH
ncbi:hypothetical protein [Demequina sp. NBRC 110055]|uniref:hypothetical protein n=1 Tax=Demequina sp. NBRC 110055 TaxID=1570344 RepID=UPI001F3C4548|nr:hypothetical protein [Demequina sp. NBRC 110055]